MKGGGVSHQEGALESSKSAMNTLAPELRAFITILRSGGPVISTRLSSRSCGSFPTCTPLLGFQQPVGSMLPEGWVGGEGANNTGCV